MDIMVETFLEIGVSDLLVSTQCLQDPLYMEASETYLSLSIGLGKQNFMISHDISLIMSVVEWLTTCITHFTWRNPSGWPAQLGLIRSSVSHSVRKGQESRVKECKPY